jgi:hypothetical protein
VRAGKRSESSGEIERLLKLLLGEADLTMGSFPRRGVALC